MATTDPVTDAATAMQRWLAGGLDRAGPASVVVVVAQLLADSAALARAAAGRNRPDVDL